jgi:hypothetical protein
MNHTEVEQPRDVVAKAVHKSTDTVSKPKTAQLLALCF